MWYLTGAIVILALISAYCTIQVILQQRKFDRIIAMLVDLGWRDSHGKKR